MTCHEFERWLDDGMPRTAEAEALDHARSCPGCAGARAATLAIVSALAQPTAPAPAGFADRVLARIEHPVLAPVPVSATPWWLRALTEPAGVLALLLIAVMTTGWKVLWAVLGAGAVALAQSANGSMAAAVEAVTRSPWGALLQRPEVLFGLELGALCVAAVAGPVLYRLSLRVASRAAGALRR